MVELTSSNYRDLLKNLEAWKCFGRENHMQIQKLKCRNSWSRNVTPQQSQTHVFDFNERPSVVDVTPCKSRHAFAHRIMCNFPWNWRWHGLGVAVEKLRRNGRKRSWTTPTAARVRLCAQNSSYFFDCYSCAINFGAPRRWGGNSTKITTCVLPPHRPLKHTNQG